MNIYMILLFIIGIIIYTILIIYWIYRLFMGRAKHEIEAYKTNEFEKDKARYQRQLREKFEKEEQLYNNELNSLNKEIEQKKEFNSSLMKIREKELDNLIEEKRKLKEAELDRDLEDWAFSAQEAASWERDQLIKKFKEELSKYEEDKEKYQEELQSILVLIEDYRKKRDVINQEILRSRAVKEKQDFYRIQLDSDSKEDIMLLNEIKMRLKKSDLLNKLIYDNYISRPTKEMVKRVLEGKNPSGIYKVTNTQTNEVYIGKSVKIADRFVNHVKSACGLEGVAESQFQRALKKYGIDNFTWELLEEVPKENLNEKEKYFIMFYGTKEYGYNQREG